VDQSFGTLGWLPFGELASFASVVTQRFDVADSLVTFAAVDARETLDGAPSEVLLEKRMRKHVVRDDRLSAPVLVPTCRRRTLAREAKRNGQLRSRD
jgi:hypothetical protein